MNCEKCKWYKQTYPVYTFGKFSARCLLGGCDESRYVPKDEGVLTYLARPHCGVDMRNDDDIPMEYFENGGT